MMVIIIMIIFLHGKTSCFFGALKLWKVHTPFLKEEGYVNDSEFPFFLSKNFMRSLFLLMSEKQKNPLFCERCSLLMALRNT